MVPKHGACCARTTHLPMTNTDSVGSFGSHSALKGVRYLGEGGRGANRVALEQALVCESWVLKAVRGTIGDPTGRQVAQTVPYALHHAIGHAPWVP